MKTSITLLTHQNMHPLTEEKKAILAKEFTAIINRESAENGSNTPDFILGAYLVACLETWNHFTRERSIWTGEEQRPS